MQRIMKNAVAVMSRLLCMKVDFGARYTTRWDDPAD